MNYKNYTWLFGIAGTYTYSIQDTIHISAEVGGTHTQEVRINLFVVRFSKESCKSSIKGITFLTIDKEDMVALRGNLKPWYQLGDTVPGTKSYHHFVPTSQYTSRENS